MRPTLSAMTPPTGADAIPSSAVMEKSSPTCAGVASNTPVANHGMHVSFATNPSALAPAAAVMTRCLLDLSNSRQSLAALIASRSRSISSSSSADMSTLIAAHSSSFSAAALISGSRLYPPVHANAAPEMRKNTEGAPYASAARPPMSGPITRPSACTACCVPVMVPRAEGNRSVRSAR